MFWTVQNFGHELRTERSDYELSDSVKNFTNWSSDYELSDLVKNFTNWSRFSYES